MNIEFTLALGRKTEDKPHSQGKIKPNYIESI